MKKRTQSTGQFKRQLIIESAVKLWQETHNVNKVSLADIARESKVSPTTVYNNFVNREGLVREVIKHLIRKTVDEQWKTIRSDIPIPYKMQSLLNIKLNTMGGLQSGILSKFARDPITKRYLDDIYRHEVMPMMDELIDEGKKQGYVHSDLPVESVALYLDMLKEGGLALADELERVMTDTQVMNGLVRIFYYGLFQKELDFKINFDLNRERI